MGGHDYFLKEVSVKAHSCWGFLCASASSGISKALTNYPPHTVSDSAAYWEGRGQPDGTVEWPAAGMVIRCCIL